MMMRATTLIVLVGLCITLQGCGSGGTGPTPPGPSPPPGSSHTVEIGPLQVGLAATAGFKTITLEAPDYGPVAFPVLFGSEIVYLRQMGFGTIALRSDADGDADIYLMDADGNGPMLKRTWHSAFDGYPTWSPDGARIAFESNRPGQFDIYSMAADGSDVRRLTNEPGEDRFPAWSPRGDKIAFMSVRSGNPDIWVMDSDGANETQLTTWSHNDDYPAWSPDGRQIAYASTMVGGDYDIFVMNADGTGIVPITSGPEEDLCPTWSPDGQWIAFSRDRDLWKVNLGSFSVSHMTNAGVSSADRHARYRPDGERLLFTRAECSWADIFLIDPAGYGPIVNLTGRATYDDAPAWCPVPTPMRTLIGPAGSDGGEDPPFGSSRPLIVVGLSGKEMVSATSLDIDRARWGSIALAALRGIGHELAGLKVTASKINQVQEDVDRGRPTRVWDVTGPPNTGAVLIFFDSGTGKVVSVIASADTALDTAAAEKIEFRGGQIVLQGRFTAVYGADRPETNVARGPVQEVVLDAKTGDVLSAE